MILIMNNKINYKKIIKSVNTFEEFKLAKSKIFSENGLIFELTSKIKNSTFEDKARFGKELSTLKYEINLMLEEKAQELKNNEILKKIKEDKNDIFYFKKEESYIHPLDEIKNRFRMWLTNNGFFEKEALEIESDEFNFQRLNIPKNHPSRDMQDSLFITKSLLLRTHNTGVTARLLSENKNKKFSAFTIGKVYRNDEDDQTHSHQFTQLDLVSVGNVSLSNLIWILKSMISYVLEEKVKIRLRSSFFPFTEPSVEVDIFFKNKWIEVLGAGMLNEKILELAGYKPGFRGLAAGIGIERLAMIKYDVKDIREFYKNDLRFLKQFKQRKEW